MREFTLIVVKCRFEEDKQHFSRNIKEKYAVCGRPGCYNLTCAAARTPSFNLHDRYGEEPHDLLCFCKDHVHQPDRAILKTIETISLDHRDEVTVWRLRGKWYAQYFSWEVEHGDFGSVLSEGYGISEWVGPFAEREQALKSVQEDNDARTN